jgi:hypothetical protein
MGSSRWVFAALAGAMLGMLAFASGAGATSVGCCDASSDATPASQLDITFDFSVVGTTLTVTVTNDDGGGFGFNVNEIYFNGSANVTSVSFTSATHSVAGDVTAAWAPLDTGTMVDGFGIFDFGLSDGVGETNANIIEPGENVAFVFTVNAGLVDADFIVGNAANGYVVAAKFTNGPDDPEDPGNEDSAYGAATPEPGALGLFALAVAGLLVASRRRL